MLWSVNSEDLDLQEEDESPEEVKVMRPAGAAPITASSQPKETGSRQECLISSGSTFKGNIDTTDGILLAGHLEGNLNSTGTVRVTGTLKGDIRAQRVDLTGGSVKGNITVTDSIHVNQASTVEGNLKGSSVDLKAGTSIVGDISAANVYIESGAKLHGQLSVGAEPEKPAPAPKEKPAAKEAPDAKETPDAAKK